MRVCDHHEPELSAFLDGELDASEARVVAAHADQCPSCASTLDRLRAVGSVLRRWDADETRYATTNAFRARVLSRVGSPSPVATDPHGLAGRLAGGRGVSAPRPIAPAGLVLVRAAAAALVIVSLGAAYSMTRSGERGPDLASLEQSLLRSIEARAANGTVQRGTDDARSAVGATDTIDLTDTTGLRDSGAAGAPWIERLRPWETVVTPAEDMPDALLSGAPPVPEVFEEHGDVRILQDAFQQWDRVQRQMRELALREEFLRLKANAVAATDRPTTDDAPVTPLGRYLGSLQVAEGSFAPYQQVQVWPIVRAGGGDEALATPLPADEALGVSALRVREGSQDDTLFLENTDRRGRSVLVLAGDVFHGGRRDRVAMEDVLLLPGQERHVRALGTGDSRRGTRRRFSRSDGLAPQRIRALLARGVDQTMLDRRVAAMLPQLGLASGNGSLDGIFGNDQLLSRADEYVRALSQRLDSDAVVGFAVAAGDDLLGIEVFPDHGAFKSMRSRVLRSYVLEALSRPRLVGEPPARAAVVTALRLSSRAANSGTMGDVTAFLDPEAGLGGYGLLDRGAAIHAVIFDGDGLGSAPGAGIRVRSGPIDSPTGPADLGGSGGADSGPTRGDGGNGSGLGGGGKR